MPNWCENELTITGPAQDLQAFRTRISEGEEISLLQAFLPMSEYHKTQEGYNDGGYEWCINTWGTKWPESDVSFLSGTDYFSLRFMTPWSPPLEGLKAIAKMNPSLTFAIHYQEEGCWYVGGAAFHGEQHSIVDKEPDEEDSFDEDYEARSNSFWEQADECLQQALKEIAA